MADAQDKLSETEYDHSIDIQLNGLDEQLEQYRSQREAEITALQEYAEQAEQVLADVFEMIKQNAISIGETITSTANEHGVQISESLTTAWQSGEGAIASYGETLSAGSSAFIANLNDVEANTWQLQDQANQTSVSIADMFANRADNLCDELQRSWDSEENLDMMTHALSDSFVHTINTGSRIGEIVHPVNDVKNSVQDLINKINEATNKLREMYAQAERTEQKYNEVQQKAMDKWMHEAEHYTYTTIYDGRSNAVRWNNTDNYRKHAKGLTKAQKDELAWTQELGDEMIVSPTRQSILTPLKAGDSVLTAEMTKNLWELAKLDPNEIRNSQNLSVTTIPNVQQNKAISLNFGSAIEVNGNVNDSMAMVKIAGQEAQSKIAETLKNLNDEIKY